jgi:hypothetical protein
LHGGLVAGVLLTPRCKFCAAHAWRYAPSRCADGADVDGRPLQPGAYSNGSVTLDASLATRTAGELLTAASDEALEAIVCVTPPSDAAVVPLELALNAVDGSPSDVRTCASAPAATHTI